MAQSALFIAIFYGIQLIWERDFGILTKLLATPTPRVALVAGKALYPTAVMPAWVRAITHVNPLSYEVNALRQLLLGLPGSLAVDFTALLLATTVGIAAASLLLGRLAR
jgi:ABC-type multidrug transport system permease subunit